MGEPQQSSQKSFRFKDSRQQRIFQNLESLIGSGPAIFYRDACILIDKDAHLELETTTHLVSHLLREVESALRDVLEPIAITERPKSSNNHREEIAAILKALGIAETEPIAQAWRNLAGRSEWTLHGRAHRSSLSSPRRLNEEFSAFFTDMEAILDHILQRLQYNYSKYFPILDALLAKPTPVDADINSLRNHVPQNVVALGYFFDRLSSPSWLVPLHDAGYFKQAIEPIYDTTQSTVSFPLWSESRYLVRMAPLAPKEVLVVRLVSFLT